MNIAYSYSREKSSETIAAAHAVAQRRSLALRDNRTVPVQRKTPAATYQHTHTASRGVFQFKSNTTGLPDQLKSGIENLSGYSMDDVKVHYHSSKPAQLQAYAYAQGSHIHIAPGQEKHLAHEAWHVVQQKQGRVKPTMQLKSSVAVNDDVSLEHEADVMGARAMQLSAISNAYAAHIPGPALKCNPCTTQRIVQRITNINYNNNAVPAATQINNIQHGRAGVNQASRNWVLANSEINQIPGGTVCNHSRDYNTIWGNLHGQLAGQTVAAAAQVLLNHYAALGIGGLPANNQVTLQNAVNGNANAPNALNDAFNYYIFKIGDYAPNLFFWPDKTNGNPDLPQTVYSVQGPLPINTVQLPGGWGFTNPGLNDATRLANEIARVGQGSNDLTGRGL